MREVLQRSLSVKRKNFHDEIWRNFWQPLSQRCRVIFKIKYVVACALCLWRSPNQRCFARFPYLLDFRRCLMQKKHQNNSAKLCRKKNLLSSWEGWRSRQMHRSRDRDICTYDCQLYLNSLFTQVFDSCFSIENLHVLRHPAEFSIPPGANRSTFFSST